MKYVRLVDSTVVEILSLPQGASLDTALHPSLQHLYSEAPDEVTLGSTVDALGNWTIAEVITPQEETPVPKVTPPEFKLLFTPQERVAMRAARSTDPVIDDFFDIVDDPRLTYVDLGLESVKSALQYLQSLGILTEARVTEILQGQVK